MTIPAWKPITVTKNLISRTNGNLECRKCELKFSLNDKIIRHRTSFSRGQKKTLYYCNSCYKGLWI